VRRLASGVRDATALHAIFSDNLGGNSALLVDAAATLWVPTTSSTSCDLGVFVDYAAKAVAPRTLSWSRFTDSGSPLSGLAC
jgi:hypothetical protein